MQLYHLLVLSIVQGLTEFLPVSSSGHLALTSRILGWPEQTLAIYIAVQAGALAAVTIYFWRDLGRVMIGVLRLLTFRGGPDAHLAIMLLIATLPVVIAGFFARDMFAGMSENVELIAWTTIGFGVLLWMADRAGMTVQQIKHLGAFGALVIGLSQVLALIPGTGRAGITMTAGRILGMERPDAARFSLLMSIPTIVGMAVLKGATAWNAREIAFGPDAGIAAGLSFAAGFVAIAAMMRWLRTSSFAPFAVYRIAIGILLLWWVYGSQIPMPAVPS